MHTDIDASQKTKAVYYRSLKDYSYLDANSSYYSEYDSTTPNYSSSRFLFKYSSTGVQKNSIMLDSGKRYRPNAFVCPNLYWNTFQPFL